MTPELPRHAGRLQDDLLQDLRAVVPAHASVPVPVASAPPPPPPPSAAAMEVRVTPGIWTGPSAGVSPDGAAIVVGVGPLQIRFGLYGR
ncbi:hypothetical protein E4P39_06700 [Blastococcus sp. CT_GayMR19]|uniref:hypothetical protein n=1 Tax=Blastococcus sp. CT_GayMR19 TaxID=2559608 RepID=UPI001073B7BE|nr:hypothetical protein [Blastococcus sp. CT_GayMR19]TFV77641.1 hypothetical protein E4P39_06700 [Blastococcus sp. CT_GayMR19]